MRSGTKKLRLFVALVGASAITSLPAATLKVSLGVRETGGLGPVFSDAGTANGIEWVNRDGQTLALDGTWQLFTFTPATDDLTPFAGTTANGLLDSDWGSIEHIRFLNADGITSPIRLWIDDVSNATPLGTVTEGFEGFVPGSEVMFQEPGFSGSTVTNLVAGSTSGVSGSEAFAGIHSYQLDMQFVDADPTRWVRLTTFGADNLQDPAVQLRVVGGPAPTISFWVKGLAVGTAVPEAGSTALLLLVGCAALGLFRSRSGKRDEGRKD